MSEVEKLTLELFQLENQKRKELLKKDGNIEVIKKLINKLENKLIKQV